MIVDLDETLEQYVQQLVSTGRYNNASEVIREALRLKIQADEEHAARLEALKRDVTHAREQVRRGEVVETCLEAFLNRSRG
ncbi:MAG: type II toxin-antitoxin system ParD family antitoxin [Myxococcales bacterium]|nr:type II toxin-antitoxin system ParD family antitoxin [Myxococcales bacterium]